MDAETDAPGTGKTKQFLTLQSVAYPQLLKKRSKEK